MKKQVIKITRNIERVLLTEVLPYEIPLIFSNKYFYALCCKKAKIFENGIISNFFPDDKCKSTIPFNFSISRKGQSPRVLSIIHPSKQREIVEFYKEHKEAILHYASQSPFSIRKPIKVGRYYFDNNDKKLEEQRNKKCDDDNEVEDRLEIDGKEGIKFKNFFSYYRYGSVHKFYESHQFHECEVSFSYLCCFDISKCFDSIYTHSIQWAIYSKGIVKGDIGSANDSFAGKLDKLMQSLNYNETHGIVIGPEFSRIFAEIILQRIDRNVYNSLLEEHIYPNTDYKIFRYVDDHFLFFNDEKVKNRILEIYTLKLHEYKMYINQAKTHQYARPIITEISIAKRKIQQYVKNYIFSKQNQSIQKISANKIITDIKIMIKDSGAEYEGITNYLLAIITSKIEKHKDDLNGNIGNILEIWDVSFFFFSVNITVSSIDKISKIAIYLLHLGESLLPNELSRIADKIYLSFENIIKQSQAKDKELYLLIPLREEQIFTLRKIEIAVLERVIERKKDINYFEIITILFYIRNDLRYMEIKQLLEQKINERCEQIRSECKSIFASSEACLLFFDLLKCPYLTKQYKMSFLERYDITDCQEKKKILKIIEQQEAWFVKWENFDLLKEFEYKKSSETYT